MVEITSYRLGDSQVGVFKALTHQRRRTVVRILERITHAPAAELAAHLVAAEEKKSLIDVTRSEVEDVQADLRHLHLPQLTDAGLVTKEDGEITTTQHPALEDPTIAAMIENDAPNWDAVLDCLADKRQRIVLTTLYRNEGAMDLTDLTAEITENVQGDSETQVTGEEVRLSLFHNDLPKLDEADLLTFDIDEETATYEGHPDLDEEWLIATVSDTPRAILSEANQSSGIWTIEGKENVIAQGQSLFDEAEDELFLMITTDGLLEEECILKLQDAIDRGVDVYVGSQTSSVRDVVRECIPEAVIWEPQMDWLALPPKHEKVGRLLFADREAVMIGTLGEEGPDGVPHETALTGAGEDNPLVMLLREMLGSRLDHLDEQSEDFRSKIPL